MKYLQWHMGLGDAIAFADLAVRIADGSPMVVPCYDKNAVSVQSIFVNNPNIIVTPIDGNLDVAADFEMVRLGCYSGMPRNEGEDMIEWVYRTAGRDHRERFDDGVVMKASAEWPHGQLTDVQVKPQTPEHYHFIHKDDERGFSIDPRKNGPAWWEGICKPKYHPSVSILAWCQLLVDAKYVHCIDSAFLHLAEQLRPRGELFYHKYARPGSESYNTLRHKWTVLE